MTPQEFWDITPSVNKSGRIIIPPGLFPEKHEMETASFLAKPGLDVEFLRPSRAKGVRSADIIIDGQLWEIKSPCGSSRRTIENDFRKAQKQSSNVIFDLRRIKLSEHIAISKIKQEFSMQRSGKIQHIIIITKDEKQLDLSN